MESSKTMIGFLCFTFFSLFSIGSWIYWLMALRKNGNSPKSTSQRSAPALTPAQNQKNMDKYKEKIEQYEYALVQFSLCSEACDGGKAVRYVCIHKETKELYTFSAKVVARRGIVDQRIFTVEPERIVSYSQLCNCLSANAKTFYSDLCEWNWQTYFDFMLLPPDHDGETLKKQFLSRDPKIVRKATFAVHDLVLKPPAVRKDFLSAAYQSLPLIRGNVEDLQMGGMFASNARFTHRALRIIEGNETDSCFCRLLIDEFGPSARGLAKKGFILVQPDTKVDEYTYQGTIECPICHREYLIMEEYTGWHIPARIHCTELTQRKP